MAPRVRQSLQYLQNEYDKGNRAPLEKLVRAWKHIQDLSEEDPNNPDGFFILGGYHGEPFHGPGRTDGTDWWGGYCNHGNVLFPTWHRAYLLRLEDALRKAPGCEDVALAFWDEYAAYSGDPSKPPPPGPTVPTVLTSQTFELDGKPIRNPLYSYTLPSGLSDALDDHDIYNKPKDYTTVRYPLSGLVGTPTAAADTKVYNASFDGQDVVKILNTNISSWINAGPVIPPDGHDTPIFSNPSVGSQYATCLNAPNYTVFSNTTSATQYQQDNPTKSIVPLEAPHNAIHLSVGGFYQEGTGPNAGDADPAPGLKANGDMGENNTAALDPMFFLHHCFVDYVFWTWQKKHDLTGIGSLSVELGYPGTNSSDSQPVVYQPHNLLLDMDTPLYPFKKSDGSWTTSHDVTDVEKQLDYTYGLGSLDALTNHDHNTAKVRAPKPELMKRVSNINRMDYKGSFVVRTYAVDSEGKKVEVGRNAVLSRWNIEGCKNCQTHLDVKSFVPIHRNLAKHLRGSRKNEDVKYEVWVQSHEHKEGKKIENAVIHDLL